MIEGFPLSCCAGEGARGGGHAIDGEALPIIVKNLLLEGGDKSRHLGTLWFQLLIPSP